MRRGTTLLEMVFAISIFMIVMTAACSTIVPGLRAFRETNLRAQNQEAILIALKKLAQELEFSDISSLSLLPADGTPATTLAFSCARPLGGAVQLDDSGFPAFSQLRVYYLGSDAASQTGQSLLLHRGALPNGRLTAFTPVAGDTVLVSNVTRFEVSAPLATLLSNKANQAGLRQNPVTVTLAASTGRYVSESSCSAVMMQDIYLELRPAARP